MNLIRGFNWIGFENYQDLLINGKLYRPLIRTFQFIITSVSLKVFVGIAFATLFASEKLLFKNLLYPLYLIPWAMPWFLLAMIWRGMFNQDFGVINQILVIWHIEPVNWLFDPRNAFITYNIVEVYLTYPFIMTVVLAAIKSIPKEIHDAATVDGASSFTRLMQITLPLIRNPLLWATLMTTIASYMIFGVPYLINGGGPAGMNEFLLIYGYKRAFDLGRYGFASAFMVLVFVIMIGLVLLFTRFTKLTRDEF